MDYDRSLRRVSVTEQGRVVERLAYGAADVSEHNQCNRLVRHDDTAGSRFLNDYGLSGAALGEKRNFCKRLKVRTGRWPKQSAMPCSIL